MKSRQSEKDIDKVFCKRAAIPRTETLKTKSNRKQNNKMKFITEYGQSLPNFYNMRRKANHFLKNNEELKNIFKKGVKGKRIVYRKGDKNIKVWLNNTIINTIDSSNIISYYCYDCGSNFIDCKYLKEKV